MSLRLYGGLLPHIHVLQTLLTALKTAAPGTLYLQLTESKCSKIIQK